jgi:hypothetical protein
MRPGQTQIHTAKIKKNNANTNPNKKLAKKRRKSMSVKLASTPTNTFSLLL